MTATLLVLSKPLLAYRVGRKLIEGGLGGTTLRRSGTSAVPMMQATMSAERVGESERRSLAVGGATCFSAATWPSSRLPGSCA